jgi:hypothetical protein
MTITGIIIDQAVVSQDIAYILTAEALFKTSTLNETDPVWESILDTDDFEALTDVTFSRVVARGSHVYVMGVSGVDGSTANLTVWYSSTFGEVFYYSIVTENMTVEVREYTVTMQQIAEEVAGPSGGYNSTPGTLTFTRIGDEGSTYNPVAFAYQAFQTEVLDGLLYYTMIGFDYTGADSILNHSPSSTVYNTIKGTGNWLMGDSGAAGELILDDYFGVGNWSEFAGDSWNMPLEAARININYLIEGWDAVSGEEAGATIWIFWNAPSVIAPAAIDMGKHNYSVVYVGTDDKIYKSIDGGAHWELFTEDYGAFDIECHMAQSVDDLDITFFSHNGYLFRTNNGAIESVFGGGVGDVEPSRVPYRISSDPIIGFPIFLLECQGGDTFNVIKSDDGVTWTDLVEDVIGARGIKCYRYIADNTRRILYMTPTAIFSSDDDGVTFDDKTGDYGTPTGAVRVELY